MSNQLAVVILAAGKGTRLKSGRAKVLHEAGGLPLAAHVLRVVKPLGGQAWLVVGHQAEAVRAVAEGNGAHSVVQRPQLGTGHALQVALRVLPRKFTQVLVLPGDAPLVTTATLLALLRLHARRRAVATVLTADLENPYGYGRILRDARGDVEAIVEQSALSTGQEMLTEVNSGMYCFERRPVERVLAGLGRKNIHREYYLTDAVAALRRAGGRVSACAARDPEEVLGANTRAELAWVDAVLRWRKVEALMEQGVSFLRPETVLVDPDVTIGADSVIEPGVQLLGLTRLGRGCRIGQGSVLLHSALAAEVTVRPYTLIYNSRVARGASVGPFAHLRDGAVIESNARIGNYVEVKKSRVGAGAKAQHLTYLGDAQVGAGTNVGAGTITCNYDGVNKNPTTVGTGAFIGSGTMLVAPVRVGPGAYVAAGSTITEDVPGHGLGIARGRQVNKAGWARTRRQVLAAAKAQKAEPSVGVIAGPAAGKSSGARKPKGARRRKNRKTKPSR